ncbi:unnamed protein product [Ilex paraguariensis]|uniref:DUF7903 domain-containing protein n=1 Tax=Ilex paraguariensis TaxID=185542 RepID=A0ABC8R548_9AQUA
MAYIPPHKRHSKDSEKPSPTPESLVPQFKRNLRPFGNKSHEERKKDKGKIVYANDAITRWFAVGLADHTQFPSALRLEPLSLQAVGRKFGEKPLSLVLDDQLQKDNNEGEALFLDSPWVIVTGNVLKELLSSFQHVKEEIETQNFEEVKPTLVARFGKVLFHGLVILLLWVERLIYGADHILGLVSV